MILELECRGAINIIMIHFCPPVLCGLCVVCLPLKKWSGCCHHLSCTGRCSCYSYHVPLVRGRSLLLSDRSPRWDWEGLITISALVFLILVFDPPVLLSSCPPVLWLYPTPERIPMRQALPYFFLSQVVYLYNYYS